MEELQDAIEDAQYVNAIATQIDGPRPLVEWPKPTDEQIQEWTAQTKLRQPDAFTIHWTLDSFIGFFQFAAFIKDSCPGEHVRMNFIEDVVRWRRVKSATGRQKLGRAKRILELYLTKPQVHPETGNLILRSPREIDEKDLCRDQKLNNLTQDQVDKLYSLNVDDASEGTQEERIGASEENFLGFKGHAVDEVVEIIAMLEDTFSSLLHKKPNANTPQDVAKKPGSTKMKAQHEGTAQAVNALDSVEEAPVESSRRPDFIEPIARADSSVVKRSASVTYVPRETKTRQKPPEKLTKSLAAGSMLGSVSDLGGLIYTKSLSESIPHDLFDKLDVMVVEYFRRRYWKAFVTSEYNQRFYNFLWMQTQPVVPDDFVTMRVLGRGGFGLVTACKKATSGKLFAMKVMNKRRIKLKKSEKLAVNERDALAAVGDSPFIVNLKYSFHHKEDVYLILDLMTGGDLGYHLAMKGKFRRRECQYYAARIMLGLQALHDKGYVFRDLKPENCLLDEDGRVKITDLGLAAKISPTLHGTAGTRGYWAPEMLRRDKNGKRIPYDHAVDWFSFGCCIAEFVSGSNPFRSETALNFGLEKGAETKEKAIDTATMEMTPEFPPSRFESDAADLCRRLLEKDAKLRLGSNGYEDIMSHPWFNDVNWEAIKSDQKQPPYIPPKDINAASQSEIGNFAEDKAYQECVIGPEDEEVYKGWGWINLKANAEEVIEFLIFERELGKPLLPLDANASCCCTIV